MRIESLDTLTPVAARCVVINVGTDLAATRALLSAVTRTELPVLLLNTDPTPSSRHHFDALMATHELDVLEVPLRYHGDQLDMLFGATADERLLLLDSDAEIRDAALASWMVAALDNPRVFGAGFVEGPFWMPETWLAPPKSVLYMERPWMPFVSFRVEPVRRALRTGRQFREFFVPNELWFFPRVANFLAARFPAPWGRASASYGRLPPLVRRRMSGWRLEGLRRLRRPYYGLRPKMVCYDTGSGVYEYLRYEEGLVFAGLDVELVAGRVHHYGGVTRSDLFGPMPTDVLATDIESELVDHLAREYAYTAPEA